MSAVNDEALIKLLQTLDTRATSSAIQLQSLNSLLASHSRTHRAHQLTLSELKSLPDSTPLWTGCGKMFIRTETEEVVKEIEDRIEEVERDVRDLGKKKGYLEITVENARKQMEEVIGRVQQQ
ncbi:hypothetical protein YB2330_000588 [Saitoella coloradoensis]